MDVLAQRLRSHRLSAPARRVADADGHMLAVQAQEFWGGRWALAVRTVGTPTMRDVDAAFGRGELVRSWTQRGTIHALAARDLPWMLSVTGARQRQQAAAVHRREGIDDAEASRAERLARAALTGGHRLTVMIVGGSPAAVVLTLRLTDRGVLNAICRSVAAGLPCTHRARVVTS